VIEEFPRIRRLPAYPIHPYGCVIAGADMQHVIKQMFREDE
jgi:hypothetical protein